MGPRRLVAVQARLVPLVDLHARRLARLRLDRVRHHALEVPEPAESPLELLLPLFDRLGGRVGGESAREPLDDVGEALLSHRRPTSGTSSRASSRAPCPPSPSACPT